MIEITLKVTTQTVSIDILPAELRAEIVEQLDHKRDLIPLSLASSRWLPVVRRRLLSSITVCNWKAQRNFAAFRAFLESSPHICEVLKRLKLFGSFPYHPAAPVTVEYMDWIMSHCPFLEYLDMTATAFAAVPLVGDHPRGTYRLKRLAVSRMPSTPSGIKYFFIFLSMFISIDELSVNNMAQITHGPGTSPDVEDHDELYKAVEHIRIRELVAYSDEICSILAKTEVSHHLRRFSLQGSDATDPFGGLSPPLLRILDRTAETLEHLNMQLLRVGHLGDGLYQESYVYISTVLRPILTQLIHLRSLSLTLVLFTRPDAPAMAAFWDLFIATVAILPHSLHSFELIAWNDPYRARSWGLPARPWTADGIDFKVLQDALQRFENLGSVRFRSWEDISDEEQEVIANAMPDLARKGAIRYLQSPERQYTLQGVAYRTPRQ